jgi:hypothetical protein
MAELVINRGPSTDFGTFSKAAVNGVIEFDWLELPDRDNIANLSRISPGTYQADTYMSPHLGYLVYLLQGVQDRSDCEIHIANWAGDINKGWYSELKGCAAPGYGIGQLMTPPPVSQMQQAILNSRTAFTDFMRITKGERLLVTINPYVANLA